MTQNKPFGISFDNRKSKILLLLSLPGFLLILSLLLLCIKPLSIYVSNCYPELIALSLLWVLGWTFIIWLKNLKDSHPMNIIIMIFIIIFTMVVSYPYAKGYSVARYVFYKRGLYAMSYNDVQNLEAAFLSFKNKDWESVKSHLENCSPHSRKFFSYSWSKMHDEIKLIETTKQNFSLLMDTYQITPLLLDLYQSLASDYGGSFNDDFVNMKKHVLTEINNIDYLYEAIYDDNADKCLELISTHGYYWFEQEIIDMIVNSEDCISFLKQIVMKDDNGFNFKKNLIYVWGLY